MNKKLAPLVVICGLSPLVPLPFVDGWCNRRVTRSLLAGLAKERGVELDAATLHTLTRDNSSMILGCLAAVFIWPFKKLLGTFFVVFIIKEMIDTAAIAAHKAAMLAHALDRGVFADGGDRATSAAHVREAMDTALAAHRTSPVGRGLRRMENADVPVPDGADGILRMVTGLRRHAGGASVQATFAESLEKRQLVGTPGER